jgi:hypothetical protein
VNFETFLKKMNCDRRSIFQVSFADEESLLVKNVFPVVICDQSIDDAFSAVANTLLNVKSACLEGTSILFL